eukprot:4269992-Amphidinium_carterae.1
MKASPHSKCSFAWVSGAKARGITLLECNAGALPVGCIHSKSLGSPYDRPGPLVVHFVLRRNLSRKPGIVPCSAQQKCFQCTLVSKCEHSGSEGSVFGLP